MEVEIEAEVEVSCSGAEDEGGTGVDVACFFLCFFREDSLPLAEERFGEPGRLSDMLLAAEEVLLGRLVGVLVPLVVEPEGGLADAEAVLSLSEEAALRSSSFLRSSSLRRSASEPDDSLCPALIFEDSRE